MVEKKRRKCERACRRRVHVLLFLVGCGTLATIVASFAGVEAGVAVFAGLASTVPAIVD